eukprot:4991559-Prymnesium_polylepis.2
MHWGGSTIALAFDRSLMACFWLPDAGYAHTPAHRTQCALESRLVVVVNVFYVMSGPSARERHTGHGNVSRFVIRPPWPVQHGTTGESCSWYQLPYDTVYDRSKC